MGRYDAIESTAAAVPDGHGGERSVRYLRRRPLPNPRAAHSIAAHRVAEGDRLDLIAHRYYGDATAWWRIAGATTVIDPDELTGPEARGSVVIVPFPEA